MGNDQTTETHRPRQPRRLIGRPVRSSFLIMAAAVAGSLFVDQVSKAIALRMLMSGPITFGNLRLHLVANRGILMGLPAPTFAVVLATIAVVVVALRASRTPDRTAAFAYGLMAGGALGNLVDRGLQRQLFPGGAVVDWISFGRMTFNLADVFLVTGVAIVVLFTGTTGDANSHQ